MRDSVSFCKQILKRRIRKFGKGKGTLGDRYLFEYVLKKQEGSGSARFLYLPDALCIYLDLLACAQEGAHGRLRIATRALKY